MKFTEPLIIYSSRITVSYMNHVLAFSQVADKELKAGNSVVVDNTNPAASTRADYIKLAKKYGKAQLKIPIYMHYIRQIK